LFFLHQIVKFGKQFLEKYFWGKIQKYKKKSCKKEKYREKIGVKKVKNRVKNLV